MLKEGAFEDNQPLAPTRVRTRTTISSNRNYKDDPNYKPSSRIKRNEKHSRYNSEKWENEAVSNFING